MIAVVIPTNRPDCLQRWRRAWQPHFDDVQARLYVVWDEPATWTEIDELWRDAGWIVPRQTDCIRSYGFWQAWRDGAEIIVSMDDDCLPDPRYPDLLTRHVQYLNKRPWAWQNTVDGFPARGLPAAYGLSRMPTMLNHGLWSQVPDVDGDTQLACPEIIPFEPPNENALILPGLFFPMSGMNVAFRRELVPCLWFGLMGPAWGVDRYGDIWAGIMTKKICDHLGYRVRSGAPCVRHERASDPVVNQRKERPGKALNELFWRWVDSVKLTADTVRECYRELAEKAPFPDIHYFNKFREGMMRWSDLYADERYHPRVEHDPRAGGYDEPLYPVGAEAGNGPR